MTTETIKTGITRFDLDDRNIRGYMVRIRRNKKQINEFFSDKRCGGKSKARKAAEARYEELLAELGPAPTSSTKNVLTKRNTSGKVGVHVAHSIDNRWPDCEYWAYCASWVSVAGKRGKIQFSWNRYGEQEAWELACLARDHESTGRDEILALHEKKKLARVRMRKPKAKPR